MLHFLRFAPPGTLLILALTPAALAQGPTITAVSPAANTSAATGTSPVTVTFSQPLTAGSAAALKVYSAQRGGLRTRGATPALASGNALTFTPSAYPFLPGETLFSTIARTAASSAGALAKARVVQFTVAAGGTGQGNFQPGAEAAVGQGAQGVAVGDVDGDGDLDLLTANSGGGTVSIRLNGGDALGSNTGLFSGNQEVAVGSNPTAVVLGDVDGDGDLDLLAVNTSSATVSVRLNSGLGVFSGSQNVAVGNNPLGVAVGDMDGDGDLDLATANTASNTISVRLNGGDATGSNTGQFSGSQEVPVSSSPFGLSLGDVDADGDLDLLAASGSSTVSVRLNGGDASGSNSGLFSGNQSVAVGSLPLGVALGDVNGDGHPDLLTANYTGGTVSVRLNQGGSSTGQFSGSQEVAVGNAPRGLALGDVDGDGDLDLLTTNESNDAISLRLNNGQGQFSGGRSVPVGRQPLGLALGDLDGDGDLDVLTANEGRATVSVRLNGGTGPLASRSGAARPSFTLAPNPAPARSTVRLTGLPPGQPVQVLDALGREVARVAAGRGGPTHLLLPAGLAPGVYLVRSGHQTARLAVE